MADYPVNQRLTTNLALRQPWACCPYVPAILIASSLGGPPGRSWADGRLPRSSREKSKRLCLNAEDLATAKRPSVQKWFQDSANWMSARGGVFSSHPALKALTRDVDVNSCQTEVLDRIGRVVSAVSDCTVTMRG